MVCLKIFSGARLVDGLLWSSALSTPMTEMPSLEKLTSSKGHQPLFVSVPLHMITEWSLQDGNLDNGGHGAMHKRAVGRVEEIHGEGARTSGCFHPALTYDNMPSNYLSNPICQVKARYPASHCFLRTWKLYVDHRSYCCRTKYACYGVSQ